MSWDLAHSLDAASAVLGAGGLGLLSYAGFRAAHFADLASTLDRTPSPWADPEMTRIREETATRLWEIQSEWSPAMGWCLRIGTLAAAASYLISFVKVLAT